MLPLPLPSLFFSSLLVVLSAAPSHAQIVYDSIHNVTDLEGTWATGVGHVQTGSNFANPVTATFNYPSTSGVSYSFTDDGYYEEAQYRFGSNGSMPNCITAVLIFQHGTYDLIDNGSMILTPFGSDGRMQVQDSCAAVTNQIMLYNQSELFLQWRIFAGPTLQLYQFDGSPLAPMSLFYKPPNMLPLRPLTNFTDDTVATSSRRRRDMSGGLEDLWKRSGAGRTQAAALLIAVVAAAGGALLMVV